MRLAGLFLLVASAASAAEPSVRNVSVRGLQVGGTTTLTIDGDDLGKAPRLLLPFAARQSLKPGATDQQATFEVTLDETPEPGYANLRVATDGGVSLPVVIGVDALPQKPLAASVDRLPVALHGTVNGSAVVETTFTGKAGQKLLAEVEAVRLGSKLRPVVHLYGPKKLQIGWSWPTPALGGDTRLEATLPEDGTYTVAVHDAEYAAAAGFFRLKLGQWSFADQVFPPVVGTGGAVELIGSEAVRVVVPSDRGPVVRLPWPKGGPWSGPRPWVEVSSRRELTSTATKGQELPTGPVGVSGKLLTPFAEDRYRVPVSPGSKVRFEVFAERIGSPVDTALVVRNEAGAEVARNEDGPGTLDPVLEYTVPDKVTAVTVGVLDAQGRGGPRAVYRLTVDPLPIASADFRLITPAQRLALPVGGRSVVPVLVERRGYSGPITLAADGLPGGVAFDGEIPAAADGVLVTVRRSDAVGEAAITTWRGRGENGTERPLVVRGHSLERLQPWLASELAIAPTTAKAEGFAVEWRGLPENAGLSLAGKLPLPVKVTRPDPAAPVRLTLLTSQLPPLANNQPDPNRTIRPEKPVELAAKATDGEVVALVPPELPGPVYDITVQAELLSPDKQKVLATAFAPVKRLPVRLPVAVKLDGPSNLQLALDAKTPVTREIKGTVERLHGFTGDVTVVLAGLPPGVQTGPVVVKAAETTFVVQVRALPSAVPGETKGLKLSATVAPDPKQPTVRVKSRDIELTLSVVGAKS